MFGLWWADTLAHNICVRWGQQLWSAYFERVYMASWTSSGNLAVSDVALWGWGAPEAWAWIRQQTVEQSHANLKRGVAAARRGGTMQRALRDAAAAWAGLPEDRVKAFNLTTARVRSGFRPTSPDVRKMDRSAYARRAQTALLQSKARASHANCTAPARGSSGLPARWSYCA